MVNQLFSPETSELTHVAAPWAQEVDSSARRSCVTCSSTSTPITASDSPTCSSFLDARLRERPALAVDDPDCRTGGTAAESSDLVVAPRGRAVVRRVRGRPRSRDRARQRGRLRGGAPERRSRAGALRGVRAVARRSAREQRRRRRDRLTTPPAVVTLRDPMPASPRSRRHDDGRASGLRANRRPIGDAALVRAHRRLSITTRAPSATDSS